MDTLETLVQELARVWGTLPAHARSILSAALATPDLAPQAWQVVRPDTIRRCGELTRWARGSPGATSHPTA